MKRRDFITLLGRAAAAWPLAARAQQLRRMRRIGVLIVQDADNPEAQARNAAFLQGLQQLGWTVGSNVRIEYRWTGGSAERLRKNASEIVALAPDVVLASGGTAVAALQQANRTIPIVFLQVTDPVGAGYVAGLARPGGNATGFTLFEFGMTGKWLELLKQIAPRVTRVAVLRDPSNPSGSAQFGAIQAVAPPLGVEVGPIDVREAGEIERAITAFASAANGGLIVSSNAGGSLHSDLIIALAARYRLPAIYPFRFHVDNGGLISYGPDNVAQWRLAAGYVDRILKGEKSADLPVQAPTKYELVINLKTAKALVLDVPASVLVRADDVIE